MTLDDARFLSRQTELELAENVMEWIERKECAQSIKYAWRVYSNFVNILDDKDEKLYNELKKEYQKYLKKNKNGN